MTVNVALERNAQRGALVSVTVSNIERSCILKLNIKKI